jgi:hypothetical protein
MVDKYDEILTILDPAFAHPMIAQEGMFGKLVLYLYFSPEKKI